MSQISQKQQFRLIVTNYRNNPLSCVLTAVEVVRNDLKQMEVYSCF